MSTATETIAFLANYNSWRRGDETLEMPSPAEIGAAIDDAVNLLRKHDDLKARADSEARAVAGVNASLDAAIIRAWGISAERDQLRAERDKLLGYYHEIVAELGDDLALKCIRDLRAEVERLRDIGCVETLLRAERAEAKINNQAERIRYLEGATNHATGTPLSRAIARAERAEAELAKDRARLDWLGDSTRVYYYTIQTQPNGNVRICGQGTGIRAAIDAAIKEEAK